MSEAPIGRRYRDQVAKRRTGPLMPRARASEPREGDEEAERLRQLLFEVLKNLQGLGLTLRRRMVQEIEYETLWKLD